MRCWFYPRPMYFVNPHMKMVHLLGIRAIVCSALAPSNNLYFVNEYIWISTIVLERILENSSAKIADFMP